LATVKRRYSSNSAFSTNQLSFSALTVELFRPLATGSGHATLRFSAVANSASYSVVSGV
jgi:hypothetical protein